MGKSTRKAAPSLAEAAAQINQLHSPPEISVRDAATLYISKGWYPVKLRPGTKECIHRDWKDRIYVPEDFEPDDNIGLRLVDAGDKDRAIKLVSIDLDCNEAIIAAPFFLPVTHAIWGRDSKAMSQALFVATLSDAITFKDLATGKMMVEVRVEHQSMAPPSLHPSGERLRWVTTNGHGDPWAALDAPQIEGPALRRVAQLIATAALVGRYYNPPGDRHGWGIALAGTLRHLGLTVDEAELVVAAGGRIASDDDSRDRILAVRGTYAKSDTDPLSGVRALKTTMPTTGKSFIASLRRIWSEGSTSEFVRDDHDKIMPNSQVNIQRAMLKMEIRLSHNQFSEKLMVQWGEAPARALDDAVLDAAWLRMDEQFGFRPMFDFFVKVVLDQARRNPFHPVKDYLHGLTWDGRARLESWLIDHGQVVDTPYVRAVSRIVLVAAVRRIMQPGCKFDELLILESGQGLQKSTALQTLCPDPRWFSDDLPLDISGKEIIERTLGRWIIESGELSGLRKSQVEALKAMLSRQVDGPVRMAYARISVEQPRQFIVVGTTNVHSYLKDFTGGRRFWPVRAGRFDVDALRQSRDQLWAEAVVAEAAGESIRLDPALYPAAAAEQDRRRSDDPWEPLLASRFRLGERQRVNPEVIWDILGLPTAQREERHQERVNAIMQKLGFRKLAVREGPRVVKGWAREASDVLDLGEPEPEG